MKAYGLIGYPLGHSFSLHYFTEKFRRENLRDCSFTNFPLEDISSLPGLIKQHPELQGLAVTIPHKKSVLSLLDEISPEAAAIGAVNCISIHREKLTGHNTDIIGFEKSFLEKLPPASSRAMVLGSGGSSLAVKYVLNKLGMEWVTVSRDRDKEGSISYEDVTPSLMHSCKVIVNCTPLGMFPDVSSFPPIPYECITPGFYLFDLVYNPEETVFLKKGKEKGAVVKNGMEMLEIQAEANWELWNA